MASPMSSFNGGAAHAGWHRGACRRTDVAIITIATTITRGVALPVRVQRSLLPPCSATLTLRALTPVAPHSLPPLPRAVPQCRRLPKDRRPPGNRTAAVASSAPKLQAEAPTCTERQGRLAATDVAADLDSIEFSADWFAGDSDAEADDQVGTHRARAARRACHEAGGHDVWRTCYSGAVPGPRLHDPPCPPAGPVDLSARAAPPRSRNLVRCAKSAAALAASRTLRPMRNAGTGVRGGFVRVRMHWAQLACVWTIMGGWRAPRIGAEK